MAIQIPNPGTGNGSTGDNEFVLWTKVKDNLTDQTNAASKLVGDSVGKVPLSEQVRGALNKAPNGHPSLVSLAKVGETLTPDDFLDEKLYYKDLASTDPVGYPESSEVGDTAFVFETSTFWSARVQTGYGYKANEIIRRTKPYMKDWTAWARFLTTANTTKDTATGFLKSSSPVLHVYNDSITKIHEAEQLDITVDKKGVGHYEIHGTTGLRKNDGWFMSPPRDVHANVLCMVDLEEKDGVVILKTYKKKFDFETVSIVHDYDNPMDIPEGVCVEFRFNDLPLDDTQTEG